jgi:SPP1 family predicted phage head-tail adaptor
VIIGPLRQRVTIETLAETRNAYGQLIPSWSPAGTFYAQIRNLAGREAVNAKQISAVVSHAVTMRYVASLFPAPGLVPSMRLLFGAAVFNIIWVDNVDNRNRQYNLLVQQIVPAVPAPS